MAQAPDDVNVADGDPVATQDIPAAVTANDLIYDDGASQTFEPNGRTTYVENGKPSHGQWYVDESGHFCSFWPPSYRACYDLHWIVTDGAVAGLRFTELGGGSEFAGRYR
jgi:hypothetical protein